MKNNKYRGMEAEIYLGGKLWTKEKQKIIKTLSFLVIGVVWKVCPVPLKLIKT